MTKTIGGVLILAGWVAWAGLAGGAEMKTEVFVAQNGSDKNPGTREKPFATLERARDALREPKKKGLPRGGATVWLRGGTYERTETFELGKEDSGTAGAPVVYRGMPGEEVRLCGGRRVPAGAFGPVADEAAIERLDPAARGKVLVADLKALGIADFGKLQPRGGTNHGPVDSAMELFFNDRPMTLARWPNTGFAMTGRILDSGVKVCKPGEVAPREDPTKKRGTFVFPNDRLARWAGAGDLWVYGFWCWDWSDEYLPVQSVDPERKRITLGRAHHYGLKEGKRFYVFNLLEELDSPGEWYLDRQAGRLYFWPPAPLEQARIVVSTLSAPLVLLEETAHITLRGLVIEVGRGTGVRILGGSDNRLAGCIIRNLGTVGIQIGERSEYGNTVHETHGGTRNGIQSCEIYNTGEGGIVLSGGDRKTLTPAGNFAVNNDIHNFSRISRTCRPAIALAGVGNRIAHNHIHHAPHAGVFFWGNDHVLEFNHVHDLCLETADAGAFYIGRDWSMRGNVLRHNFVHDIGRFAAAKEYGGTMAFYLDDWASGTTLTGNVVSKVHTGVMIGSGKDNLVEGNLLINCSNAAVHMDARGRSWAKSYFDGRHRTLFDRIKAVNYGQPPYSERYPALAKVLEGDPALPTGNRIANNVCVGGRWLDLHDGLNAKTAGVGENLIFKTAAEAGLADPGKGDFRLKDDSPVFQKLPGFKPIPFEKIGLYDDEYRRELPARGTVKNRGKTDEHGSGGA